MLKQETKLFKTGIKIFKLQKEKITKTKIMDWNKELIKCLFEIHKYKQKLWKKIYLKMLWKIELNHIQWEIKIIK
jgi:hypothetical protein